MIKSKKGRGGPAGRKVLVINDNAADYGRIRKAFRQCGPGANLQFVNSAGAGLEVIEKENIKAVFVNEFLPDMDGFNFLRKLKKLNTDMPVIMVLSSGGEKLGRQGIKAGRFRLCDDGCTFFEYVPVRSRPRCREIRD